MPPPNPVHNTGGYSAVAAMAIGVLLMIVANAVIGSRSALYHVVEFAGAVLMFTGATSLAIIYYVRSRRDQGP
jgi:hypothetical protein